MTLMGLLLHHNAHSVRDQPKIDHTSRLTLHPWTIQVGSSVYQNEKKKHVFVVTRTTAEN